MVKLYDKKYSREELMRYVGDIAQAGGINMFTFDEGRANGVRAAEIKTGELSFTVLLDRGMDIAWMDYCGIPFAFISKTGICSEKYFEYRDAGFLRNFTGGFLTTCGLRQTGSPCVDEGEELGLHGRISNSPAEKISVVQEWADDEYALILSGAVRESAALKENLVLTRKITTALGSSSIRIADTVENCGFKAQPLMLLYHFNLGFPFLSKETELEYGFKTDEDKQAYSAIREPEDGFKEKIFSFDLKENSTDDVSIRLHNRNLGVGLEIGLQKEQLRFLNQWQHFSKGDYVLGIEPGTNKVGGRENARERGELQFIGPFEKREFFLEIQFFKL